MAPQKAEDYEADQVRIRARSVVSAQSLRYIKQAQRPVELEEIAQAIEAPVSEVADAIKAAMARDLVVSRPSADGGSAAPVFELAS
jgi:hypothetical protein